MNDTLLNDADRLGAPTLGPEELDPYWDLIDQHAPRHYDKSGNAISMRDWCRLRAFDDLNGHRYARVARSIVGKYVISTVWLGLDCRLGHGPPQIFETMVFKDGEGDEQWRYETEEEAKDGHLRVVNEVALLNGLEP